MSRLDDIIRASSMTVGALSVPCGVIPGADTPLLVTQWSALTGIIIAEHGLNRESNGKPTLSKADITAALKAVTAAFASYKVGSTILQYAATAVLSILTGGLWLFLGASGIVLLNALLNSFFTWKLGHRIDKFFSANDEPNMANLLSIMKEVVTVFDESDFKAYWKDCNLSFSEIKSWLKKL